MSNIDVTYEMLLLSGGIRWLAAIAAVNMRKSKLNVKTVTTDHFHVPAASMRFHSDTQHMLYARDLVMCAKSMFLGGIRVSQHANGGDSVCKWGETVCQKACSDCNICDCACQGFDSACLGADSVCQGARSDELLIWMQFINEVCCVVL